MGTKIQKNQTEPSRKDEFWFTHSAHKSQDPKIVALIQTYGLEGYGRYWILIEFLRMQTGYQYDISQRFSWSSLSQILRATLPDCKRFIDDLAKEFDLLTIDGQFIYDQDLKERMAMWDEKKKSFSDRGRKGAEVTNAKRTNRTAQPENNGGTAAAQADKKSPIIEYDIIEEKKIEQEMREGSTHSSLSKMNEEETEVVSNWFEWLEENAKSVLHMAEPLTSQQILQLVYEWPGPDGAIFLQSIILKLHNWPDDKKKKSAHLTIMEWIEIENSPHLVKMRDRIKFNKKYAEKELMRGIAAMASTQLNDGN